MCEQAMRSDRAKALSASYRAMLRRHFDAIFIDVGTAPMTGVREKHIRANLTKADNKTDRLKAWRFWTKAAIEAGLIAPILPPLFAPLARPVTGTRPGQPTISRHTVTAGLSAPG